MTLLHSCNYYPPPSIDKPAPVRIEINFETTINGEWRYNIEIKLSTFAGIACAATGTVEADHEDKAIRKIYAVAMASLAELLAERIAKGSR
jgi:hypothetical protein